MCLFAFLNLRINSFFLKGNEPSLTFNTDLVFLRYMYALLGYTLDSILQICKSPIGNIENYSPSSFWRSHGSCCHESHSGKEPPRSVEVTPPDMPSWLQRSRSD